MSLRAELERTQQALAVLQRNFDEFHDSSREVEEELEAELARVRLLVHNTSPLWSITLGYSVRVLWVRF